ncbi:ALG3-domain-containing protein [Neoconidiobolus thromboides FSU 785]|nr:ALG3-domain-containing protein [Neoconidiobolus thromboides FSU 785]
MKAKAETDNRINKSSRFKPIGRKIYTLLTDPKHNSKLCNFIIVLEVLFNLAIIFKVNYTEIDWKAYMQEVGGFLDGELDYSLLRGDTGPLVYPGLFVYIYSIFYVISNQGKNILLMQFIYLVVYIVQIKIMSKIHCKTKLAPIYLLLLCYSKRIHSIYVLRLFNDPIAMLLCYIAIYFTLNHQFYFATMLYSLAVGIKMNVLLFMPGYLFILFCNKNLVQFLLNIATFFIAQILIGLPFLLKYPQEYVNNAFEFNRKFDFQWTVNWRMFGKESFESNLFAKVLLFFHLFLLLFFLFTCWIKPYGGLISFLKKRLLFNKNNKNEIMTSKFMLEVLYISNFIGILCSRTLHYQFYSWYYHTLPFLFCILTRVYPKLYLILQFILLEYCWNIYPSTNLSSTLLLSGHLSIILGLWLYQFLTCYPHLNLINVIEKKKDE